PIGLAAGGLSWSSETSIWFGHQSWFVIGRCACGLGEGIAGFSLSLRSDTSRLLLSRGSSKREERVGCEARRSLKLLSVSFQELRCLRAAGLVGTIARASLAAESAATRRCRGARRRARALDG